MVEIKHYKLDCRPIFNSNDRPKGELKDWLIKKGLNPKKYIEVSLPIFQVFYINRNRVFQHSCKIDTYSLSNINIKELEYTDTIYIFKPDYSRDDELRIYPIITGVDYKRWLRARKLERILWQED